MYRRLLKMALEQLQLIEQQVGQLDQEMASLLNQHEEAVQRLAKVPDLGVHSAQQIIAEVGPTAATFPSQKCLSSWVGACPGDDESAGLNYSHRSPKGNRHMRRVLNQCANAAVKKAKEPSSTLSIAAQCRAIHAKKKIRNCAVRMSRMGNQLASKETRDSRGLDVLVVCY